MGPGRADDGHRVASWRSPVDTGQTSRVAPGDGLVDLVGLVFGRAILRARPGRGPGPGTGARTRSPLQPPGSGVPAQARRSAISRPNESAGKPGEGRRVARVEPPGPVEGPGVEDMRAARRHPGARARGSRRVADQVDRCRSAGAVRPASARRDPPRRRPAPAAPARPAGPTPARARRYRARPPAAAARRRRRRTPHRAGPPPASRAAGPRTRRSCRAGSVAARGSSVALFQQTTVRSGVPSADGASRTCQ